MLPNSLMHDESVSRTDEHSMCSRFRTMFVPSNMTVLMIVSFLLFNRTRNSYINNVVVEFTHIKEEK